MDKNYLENLANHENGDSNICFIGNRKKIFLIGDSLRRGYSPFVKEILSSKYEVVYPNDNCRNTQYVITSLFGWVNMFENPNDVVAVCFNCGHWDIAHWDMEEECLTPILEYQRNIRRIIKKLKNFFPKAKILFFTTSPIMPLKMDGHTNPRTNEEIEKYNQAAVIACQQENIVIKDMNAFMKDWNADCYLDYAHPTQERSAILGQYVADALIEMLEKEI